MSGSRSRPWLQPDRLETLAGRAVRRRFESQPPDCTPPVSGGEVSSDIRHATAQDEDEHSSASLSETPNAEASLCHHAGDGAGTAREVRAATASTFFRLPTGFSPRAASFLASAESRAPRPALVQARASECPSAARLLRTKSELPAAGYNLT